MENIRTYFSTWQGLGVFYYCHKGKVVAKRCHMDCVNYISSNLFRRNSGISRMAPGRAAKLEVPLKMLTIVVAVMAFMWNIVVR